MLIVWGACGHAKASATTQCRVCWCLAFESDIDRTNWDPSHEDEDRRLYNAEADRERAHREWDTRQDEANDHEYFATTPIERPANNAQHDLVICLSGQVLRDAIGWTWREVPFYASRYHVSGEPYAEYLNPHVGTFAGLPIVVNRRRGFGFFEDVAS